MKYSILLSLFLLFAIQQLKAQMHQSSSKTRVIVTSDGEIDDECSMVRFLLYANEWDIEGIITSSSQYHWRGHKWAGDNWLQPSLDAYEKVYPNLIKHDKNYPSPQYLKDHAFLGNVDMEGEMDQVTAGSQQIVKVLLDEKDPRPIWLQAWGGTNTIARALKTIEESYPKKMAAVANKLRFFFIWEQDSTYQAYIKPHWGKYQILTIISDQFEAMAYRWKQVQPKQMLPFFQATWMKENILENHGPLCALYKAHTSQDNDFEDGDFRSEGDSPAFMHTIKTGLENLEQPNWGGWGGRYINVRDNTWLDPVPVKDYQYPTGRWYGSNGWGRSSLRPESNSLPDQREAYFKPIWQWSDAFQNDFAARADWCVKSFRQANHPPVVHVNHPKIMKAKPGAIISLSAKGSLDPDGNLLFYRWWQYQEAGACKAELKMQNAEQRDASLVIPKTVSKGDSIHIICEVKDNGIPVLTRYQRVVIEIE